MTGHTMGLSKKNSALIISAVLNCIIDLIRVPTGGQQMVWAIVSSVCKLQLCVASILGKPFMNSITIDRNQARIISISGHKHVGDDRNADNVDAARTF